MANLPDWLPSLVLFQAYRGDWERYLQALYAYFAQDFINSKPLFGSDPIALKRHPVIQGKEATFWHLISEGELESARLPDLRRCERIRWPRPAIEHASESVVKVWENERGSEKRVCLWLESAEYLVVLARRRGYVLIWTAFPVTEAHRKRKLQREYEASKNG